MLQKASAIRMVWPAFTQSGHELIANEKVRLASLLILPPLTKRTRRPNFRMTVQVNDASWGRETSAGVKERLNPQPVAGARCRNATAPARLRRGGDLSGRRRRTPYRRQGSSASGLTASSSYRAAACTSFSTSVRSRWKRWASSASRRCRRDSPTANRFRCPGAVEAREA